MLLEFWDSSILGLGGFRDSGLVDSGSHEFSIQGFDSLWIQGVKDSRTQGFRDLGIQFRDSGIQRFRALGIQGFMVSWFRKFRQSAIPGLRDAGNSWIRIQ